GSIFQAFVVAGGMFAAMSIYGYTTKKDLSGMGSFLIMGLFGIIIASIVNLFLGSSALQFAISVIGVLVFAGLTAYDTQRIKEMYFAGDDAAVMGRKAIMGALSLYLNFINMFIMLLQLFGQARE
ncbi:MAG TPA: Bax inhibitor-1/YccA family protein, partial [Methylomirabilota bacterium]|nr:Bax inhibitor-1/YccA family protein [Methylomirabilota bacterium]